MAPTSQSRARAASAAVLVDAANSRNGPVTPAPLSRSATACALGCRSSLAFALTVVPRRALLTAETYWPR